MEKKFPTLILFHVSQKLGYEKTNMCSYFIVAFS